MCLCVHQTINVCWAVFGGHFFSQAPANVTNATTAAAKTPIDTADETESTTQLAKLSGDDDVSSSAGAVAGIAVAVVALLAIVVAGVVYRRRRKARMGNGHVTRRGIVTHTNQVGQCQIINIALIFQNGAKSGSEMCFAIGSRLGENTSRIQHKEV